MKEYIEELKKKVLDGQEIEFDEAMRLIEIDQEDDLNVLLEAAQEITFHFNTKEPGLCSLINAKSNLCGEDCGFCSQSVRFDTRVETYGLMKPEEVLEAAKDFEKKGAKNFCVVTSGGALTDKEFESILEMYRLLKKETNMSLDGSLGFLTKERVEKLKEVGLRRFNNNLQTSRDFYPEIVSTHSYDTRIETMKMLQEGNMEICSGGILGMGESREDRVKLAFELKPFEPHCLPMNVLNPIAGTPLENQETADPLEMVKTIAVYRFIHPKSNIKLAGGRESNLGAYYQEKSLKGGANGLIIGGYLTTEGNPMKMDFEMLKRAGFEPGNKNEPIEAFRQRGGFSEFMSSKPRTILITGGTGALGEALVKSFLEEGGRVFFTYFSNVKKAEELEALGARGTKLDLRSSASIEEFVKALRSEVSCLDVLIHNAAAVRDGRVETLTEEDWDDVCDVNVKAPYYLTKKLLRLLFKSEQGKVFALTSRTAFRGGYGASNYAASKAALVGLMLSLAKEIGKKKVLVNLVNPGFMLSGMTQDLSEKVKESQTKASVLHEFSNPLEVAEFLKYLSSPNMTQVSGQVFNFESRENY